jgi:peptide/nickel transport system permease protein
VSFIHRARIAVFMEAGLAFIGIADPLMISWGTMMHHALKFYYLPVWKWWLLPPGFALSLLIISFTFLGHSLEGIIEPRLRNA